MALLRDSQRGEDHIHGLSRALKVVFRNDADIEAKIGPTAQHYLIAEETHEPI